jgi:hypothetical protein
MTKHRHKHANPAQPGPDKATTTTKAAIACGDKDHNAPMVSVEDIRLCAYQKWVNAGKPIGDGIQFWREAEHELVQGK